MNGKRDVKTIAASRYYLYAGKNIDAWRSLVGQRIMHSTFNEYGNISQVTQDDYGYILLEVHFDNPVQSKVSGLSCDKKLSSKIFNSKIIELTLPIDLLTEVENYENDILQAEKQERVAKALSEKEALSRKQKQISQKHQEHMQRYGVPYRGERNASIKILRETHCWRCKKSIDNMSLSECVACGWIICQCGACGCGYSQK